VLPNGPRASGRTFTLAQCFIVLVSAVCKLVVQWILILSVKVCYMYEVMICFVTFVVVVYNVYIKLQHSK